jgi:hypothetical protein
MEITNLVKLCLYDTNEKLRTANGTSNNYCVAGLPEGVILDIVSNSCANFIKK